MTKKKYLKLNTLILSLTFVNHFVSAINNPANNVAGNIQDQNNLNNNGLPPQQNIPGQNINPEVPNPEAGGQFRPNNYPGGQNFNQPRFNNEVPQNNYNSPQGPNYDYNGNAESLASGNGPHMAKSNNSVVLNFENADIRSVIRAISELSGKNFVVDPKVKGVINIISDRPISKEDSYKVLESALRMQGYGTVEADGVIKVLPEQEAKTYGMQTENFFKKGKSPHQLGDQIITKIFVIEHGSASQLANAVRPLIAPNNSISVYSNNNSIILTDYASNIKRISNILNKLSIVEGGSNSIKPVIITFKNAVAADAVQMIQSYMGASTGFGGFGGGQGFGSGNQDGPTVQITVSPNTNSIILSSTNASKLKEITNVALNIDKDMGEVQNNMHVVYLKNADAMHIAEVLRTIVSGQDNPDITASSTVSRFISEPSSSFGTTASSGGGGGGSSGGTGISSNQRNGSGGSRGGVNNFQNGVNQKDQPKILVQAEPTTNSLIIQAPLAVYKNLRMIIEMLDVRRAQVMIEAMIADISATQSGTLGVQWLAGAGSNNGGVLAVANYGQNGNQLSGLASSFAGASSSGTSGSTSSASAGINLPNEVYVGLVTGTTTVGGQQVPTIGALADMINANSVGNVLSRPTMITLDNEEVRIMVGSNIGIPNGSYQNTAAVAGNLVTTITRQDLGVVLQVKPLITQSGSIQLDIWQENSLLDPNQPLNANINGPSFLRRNLRATVLVDDGQIIALGGMSADSITITQNGVPGLSQIPYIGWLFSWERRQHIKSNLVLFLRPVIIKNIEGYKTLTNQRYSYIVGQESLAQIKGSWGLPEIKPVTLDNQVPYSTHGSLPGQSNPSLNINKNLPIVDLTQNGENFKTSDVKSAIKVEDGNVATSSVTKTSDNK